MVELGTDYKEALMLVCVAHIHTVYCCIPYNYGVLIFFSSANSFSSTPSMTLATPTPPGPTASSMCTNKCLAILVCIELCWACGLTDTHKLTIMT